MVSRPVENCAECGFDATRWNNQDTTKTVRHLADFANHAVAGADSTLLSTRPDDNTWSVAEYIDHMREVTFGIHLAMQVAIQEPGADLGEPPDQTFGAQKSVNIDDALEGLASEAALAFDFLRKLDDQAWEASVTLEGYTTSIDWFSRHIVHDAFHHLHDIATIRHRLGDTVELHGKLHQVNASDGGVPKTAVADGTIDLTGLATDTQAARQHHGRPWQALCLFSTEVIAGLQAEGHPIEAGSAGENLTLSGIDWNQLRSGLVLRIGDVAARLTLPAEPCAKNNRWFSGTTSERIDHERHPGSARWYASVLQPGSVQPGDSVSLTSH